MEFATGALGTLLPKLANLLHGGYNLQKNVRKNIEFLTKELEIMQAALRSVGEVPTEQLQELVRIWSREVRELSYDMEDVVDTFLVRVEGPDRPSKRNTKKFLRKMKSLLAIGKRHQINEQIKDVKERVMELAARRDRYKIDTINLVTTLDPRITNLYAKPADIVGINKAREELLMKLTTQEQRIVSIVGFGGLGKTTLAKAVYDEIKSSKFIAKAFVTVSRNPDMKRFFKDMLYELDNSKFGGIHSTSFDVNQLIDKAREFLGKIRYFIIIDDIWDISNWNIIKCALPDDNTGSRIITTTRKLTVANYIGNAYEIKPLSSDKSRVLLCRRIFGNEDLEKYLDKELAQVSNKILQKCAGVPLAIITVASLLANKGRNKAEWEEVYNSIGNGMENSLDADNMRKILSYSYYDLPSYLRTCLLYVSMFPEDFEIENDRLIWLWIAEGFIQHEKQSKKSLFELGESYLSELINRSMIQPIYDYYNTKIDHCCVHDMVLDLIRSISSEENFVTRLSNMDQIHPSTMARRMSLQNGVPHHAMTQATWRIPSVRSLVVFPSALHEMPALRSFKVLRVLDLEGCDFLQGYDLEHLGNLFHLRYLSLKHTRINQLPEAVGKLQFLEILNIAKTGIGQLPKCVAQLKHLLCLLVDSSVRLSNVIGSLTALEELSWLRIGDESRDTDTIQGLGLLSELRVLCIMLCTDKWGEMMMKSLMKLRKIQRLCIHFGCLGERSMGGLDAWVAPPKLRSLDTQFICWFSKLPAWMNNPTQFQNLHYLSIAVRELQQEDLQILGRLPALRDLQLKMDHKGLRIVGRRFTVGAGSFPCLVRCEMFGFLGALMFQQGAMPRLTRLYFDFHVPEAREIAGSNGGLNLGLGNLLSLKEVFLLFQSGGASEEEVEEAKAAVRHAAQIHPNLPYLKIQMMNRGLD